jgi:hypothetical protein
MTQTYQSQMSVILTRIKQRNYFIKITERFVVAKTLSVRTQCKRVAWKLGTYQVYGGNAILTDNKKRI